ncbi:hypothetical protein JCM8097_003971 [Rhodosporidiobolus ruineniae]
MKFSRATPQAAFLAAATASAAASSSSTSASSADSKWTLSTTNFQRDAFQVQPYVANGYIGQRIPAEGFGYKEFAPINQTAHNGTQGWPLFTPRMAGAFVAGFYDEQPTTEGTNFPELEPGEQPLSALPTWSSLYLTIDNQTYSTATPDAQVSNYHQSLSIQDGVVRTELDWTPEGFDAPVSLRYTVLAHRDWANVGAVRLTVRGLTENMTVAVTDVLDGAGAWRTDPVSSGPIDNYPNTLHTAVRPVGISNVTAYEVSVFNLFPFSSTYSLDSGSNCLNPTGAGPLSSNASTASQCYRLTKLPETGVLDAIKYVGIASSDSFPGRELETALHWARHANLTGYDAVRTSHEEAWAEVRNGDEPTGRGDNSIAPAGLTSDSYAGQIFWDADTWMYPSLLALHPSYAESIIDFRYRQLGAAQENAQKYNLSGALYPWTAGRFGNCTGVGPCYDYEYHLNSDIALAAWQYYATTGNKTWLEEKGYPLVRNAADMFASFVVRDEATGMYHTYNETSPDEYSNHKNDSAMINGALSVTLQHAADLGAILGYDAPTNWSDIRENITMLTSPQSGILLEFDGFNGTTEIKQADVVLLTYPFEYERSKTLALQDLDYYSAATSPNGPGMTYSVYAIIANELSPIGCASYSYFLQSAQPYSRAPYYQFSEQTNDVYATNGGTNPAYTFLTGHGGFLQTLTHGFTGYRFRLSGLYFDPLLPPQLTNYTLKGLKWGGASFDVTVQTEQTTITRRAGGSGSGNETIAVEIGSANEKAGNYTLAPGESLTVPTRSTASGGSLIPNNLAQCARVLANDTSFNIAEGSTSVVPGEFGLAAVDGANATTWQPLTPDPSTLTIDLGGEKTITALHFNWGSEPPTAYSVLAANASSDFASSSSTTNSTSPAVSLASGNITLSDLSILSSEVANQVTIHVGNLTDIALPQPVVARFVELTVSGSWNEASGYGGSVAEVGVIGH